MHDVIVTRASTVPLRRLAVIYNPAAGQRRGRLFRATVEALRTSAFQLDLIETEYAGHATHIARRLAEAGAGGPDAVVVAGGDGTINEAVNGLAGGELPFGIIPLGTANVLALELGLPRDPLGIAACFRAGVLRPVHLGQASSVRGRRYFLMMAGVGYDAHVVAGVSAVWKRRVGKLAYVAEMLRQLRRFHFLPYRLSFDGGAPVDAASAILANGRHYGGAFVCAPAADLGLARLDACLFGDGGPLAAVKYGINLGLNRVPRLASVSLRPFSVVEIQGPAGDPVQGDGDIIAVLPARIEVAAIRLRVVAPAAALPVP